MSSLLVMGKLRCKSAVTSEWGSEVPQSQLATAPKPSGSVPCLDGAPEEQQHLASNALACSTCKVAKQRATTTFVAIESADRVLHRSQSTVEKSVSLDGPRKRCAESEERNRFVLLTSPISRYQFSMRMSVTG